MYDYIKGSLAEITPTEAVVENNGIGYKLQISLQTYADIQSLNHVKLYIHHHLREDIEQWYGFNTKEERSIFTMLIEVSGIGPNTARMMLSSMTSEEIKNAIVAGDVNRIKSIKGIGLKTAQRVIIDLKDKIMKGGNTPVETLLPSQNNANREEALSALVLLGFAKNAAEKVLQGILKENPDYSLEEMIKIALKRL
jgi:Holliday junction DNA helicase RuvA